VRPRHDRNEERLFRAAQRREQHPQRDDYVRPADGLGIDYGKGSRIYPGHPKHPLTPKPKTGR
jgi:hypothetical protein